MAIKALSAARTPEAAGVWLRAMGDLMALAKPRIVALMLLTALVGFLAAPARDPAPLALLVWTLVGVGLAAGGGGCLNCYFDRDVDGLMRRTASRPLPAGRLAPWVALVEGLLLSAMGPLVLAWRVHGLAAWLAGAGVLIYVGVYTLWLKRRTPQNIVIGGAAGAIPPMIGWAAVTGRLDAAAWALFAIIFLWTPPHFWSLALMARDDYRRAGIPMLPVAHGERRTRREMLLYSILLAIAGVVPWRLGVGSARYAVVAAALGLGFVALALVAALRPSPSADRRTFHFSLVHLAALFVAMVLLS